MAIRERLIYAIDVVTDGARTGLTNFKTAVSDADTTTGKFKAGANAAFAEVKANAGALALGAGVAFATYGAKAVAAFTETAKAAVDGAAATGLNVEQMSRWIAVGDDFQVSAEQLVTGIGKIGKSLDDAKWERYGIATRDAAGNAREANDILLDAFDVLSRTTNETERARIGNELFGKGYANLAPLIGKTRDQYESMLGSVEKGQVITAKEAEQAEKTRLAIDQLQDAVNELTLALGGKLAPAVTNISQKLTKTIELADKLKVIDLGTALMKWANPATYVAKGLGAMADGLRGVGGMLGIGGGDDVSEGVKNYTAAVLDGIPAQEGLNEAIVAAQEAADPNIIGSYTDKLNAMKDAYDPATAAARLNEEATERKAEADDKARQAADRHRTALDQVAAAMERQRDAALDLVGGDIAVRDAQRDAEDAAAELNETLKDQDLTLRDAGAAIDSAADAQLRAAESAAEFRARQMEANGQQVDARTKAQLYKEELTRLAGEIDGPLRDAILRYIAQLDAIPRNVQTNMTVTTRQGDTGQQQTGRRAAGGPVAAGGFYEVNENGSELLREGGRTYLMPGKDGQVIPLRDGGGSATGGSGGAPIVFNVSMTGVNDPNRFAEELARFVRQNGPGTLRRMLGLPAVG